MSRAHFALILTISLFSDSLEIRFPQDFDLCHVTDPEIETCIAKAISTAYPKVTKGIKNLGLAPLEPLTLPSVQIGEGTRAVRFTQKYKNLQIHNITRSTVDSVKVNLDPDNFILDAVTLTKKVSLMGNYAIEGRILIFPIVGNGSSLITLRNVRQRTWIQGKQFKKPDGKTYMKVANLSVDTQTDRLHIQLGNLFNGNEELGNQLNRVLNDNWEFVYAEVKDKFEEIFKQVYTDYLNKIFTNIPTNELFLP